MLLFAQKINLFITICIVMLLSPCEASNNPNPTLITILNQIRNKVQNIMHSLQNQTETISERQQTFINLIKDNYKKDPNRTNLVIQEGGNEIYGASRELPKYIQKKLTIVNHNNLQMLPSAPYEQIKNYAHIKEFMPALSNRDSLSKDNCVNVIYHECLAEFAHDRKK